MSDPTRPLTQRKPDFEQFLKILRREGKPTHLPFYEHVASAGFIATRTGTKFDQMTMDDQNFWPTYIDFWLGLGYDCIPMEISFSVDINTFRQAMESDEHKGAQSRGSDDLALVTTMEEYEAFPWPDEAAPINFKHFETVAKLLPEGVKIVGGAAGGPYEWMSQVLMGVTGLSYGLIDNPELVDLLFKRLGKLYVSTVKQLATMDEICALRQGDDLGFKTSTFLRPEDLRKHVFPIYKAMAQAAHDQGKPFILHSCGQLQEVYEDLIEECKIDAKHSYEDVIMPVQDFKKKYGQRITPLGGLDVDFICQRSEEEIRKYTQQHIEECFYDGYWALGTGNSLTNYMPVNNYLAVLEEGLKV